MPFFCVLLPSSRGKRQRRCSPSQCTFIFPDLGFWSESGTAFLVLVNTKEISRTPSLKVQTTQCFADRQLFLPHLSATGGHCHNVPSMPSSFHESLLTTRHCPVCLGTHRWTKKASLQEVYILSDDNSCSI